MQIQYKHNNEWSKQNKKEGNERDGDRRKLMTKCN